MTRPGIEPRSPGPSANTLPNEPFEANIVGADRSGIKIEQLVMENDFFERTEQWEGNTSNVSIINSILQ